MPEIILLVGAGVLIVATLIAAWVEFTAPVDDDEARGMAVFGGSSGSDVSSSRPGSTGGRVGAQADAPASFSRVTRK